MLGLPLAIGAPFIPTSLQLKPFVAELWLIGGILAVLFSPLLGRRGNIASASSRCSQSWPPLVTLLITGGEPHGITLRGMLLSDPLAVYWKVLLLVFTAGIIVMWFRPRVSPCTRAMARSISRCS